MLCTMDATAMKLVNSRLEPFTHYIGRGSPFGNPFTHLPLGRTQACVHVPTVTDAVDCFDLWVHGDEYWDGLIPRLLRDKLLAAVRALPEDVVLGCFGCKPRCHGDVIMTLWQEMHAGTKNVGAKK